MTKQLLVFFLIFFFATTLYPQNGSERWESYLARYADNKPGSTTVRMDLADKTPIPSYDYVLITGVTYKSEREDGFPQGETFEFLRMVGDDLIKLLDAHGDNLLVGSFMSNFERLEYFYLKSDIGIEQKLEEFYTTKYPDYKFYINIKEDKKWTYYREFLYPNEEIQNYLADQNVIRNLQKAGDKLTKKRRVEHWVYFTKKSEMESFKLEVIEQGFKVQFAGKIEDASTPYELKFWRIDKVDIESIYPITSSLRKLALAFNGDYDGWETSVERE